MDKSKLLARFFAFATLEGLLCLIMLLALTPDPETGWLLGYSRSRSLMLAVNLIGIILFIFLLLKTKRNSNFSDHIIANLDILFKNERKTTFVLFIFLFLSIGGLFFIYSAYAHVDLFVDHFVRPQMVATFELIRIYMSRLVPFVLWGMLLSFQSLVTLSLLGYSTRNFYYRVVRLISLTIFPLLLIVFWILSQLDPDYYHHINKEDQLVEWLTFASLIGAGFLSLVKSYKAHKTNSHYFWFFVFFGIACLVLGMEEISWGQRIFQIESSEFFIANSDQQEINVHNVINEWFSIRTKHVAAFVLFVFGVGLPLIALNKRMKILFEKIHIVVPPLFLSFGFALGAFLTLDIFSGREEEIAELFLSLSLLLFIILENLRSSGSINSLITPDNKLASAGAEEW